ncbi:hypothetical protein KCU65_g2624, partial [Aureobasidium melanogenum]
MTDAIPAYLQYLESDSGDEGIDFEAAREGIDVHVRTNAIHHATAIIPFVSVLNPAAVAEEFKGRHEGGHLASKAGIVFQPILQLIYTKRNMNDEIEGAPDDQD